MSEPTAQPDDLTGAWESEAHPTTPPAVEPSADAGPTVAECAEADRRWPLEKAGE